MSNKYILVMLGLSAVSSLAMAHVNGAESHSHGFAVGLLHPFTGVDHLAAMLAVGVWSVGSPRRWQAPLGFMLMLLTGAWLTQAGITFPAVEPTIAGSLIVVGAMLLSTRRMAPLLGAATMGCFALFHGAAHGHELTGASALSGMVLGTAALHVLGIAIGLGMQRRSSWMPRAAGLAVAALGFGLLN